MWTAHEGDGMAACRSSQNTWVHVRVHKEGRGARELGYIASVRAGPCQEGPRMRGYISGCVKKGVGHGTMREGGQTRAEGAQGVQGAHGTCWGEGAGHFEGGHRACMWLWLGLGHMKGMQDVCGMAVAH